MIFFSDCRVKGVFEAMQALRIEHGLILPDNTINYSDSTTYYDKYCDRYWVDIGPKDEELLNMICKNDDYSYDFLSFISVWVTIYAPIEWWEEFDKEYGSKVSQMKWDYHNPFEHEHAAVITNADGSPLPPMETRYIKTDFKVLRDIWLDHKGDPRKIWHDFFDLYYYELSYSGLIAWQEE